MPILPVVLSSNADSSGVGIGSRWKKQSTTDRARLEHDRSLTSVGTKAASFGDIGVSFIASRIPPKRTVDREASEDDDSDCSDSGSDDDQAGGHGHRHRASNAASLLRRLQVVTSHHRMANRPAFL